MIRKFLSNSAKPKAAIFLSGSGSNAEKLLESLASKRYESWDCAVLVTDRPKTSKTIELAERFNVPYIALGIKDFYTERGESRVTLMTERGREIREEWTKELRSLLAPYNVDFGILAGFVPLTNITNDFPCLNVHPGDLTVEQDGQRILVGLHTVPVEIAILEGLSSMRSSVILAQGYTGKGGEMDSGPIIGLSGAVEIDFKGKSLDELKEIAAERSDRRPVGGFKDELEEIADHNQTLLKESGDWCVFPPAVNEFALNNFACDEDETLYLDIEGELKAIKTVVYTEEGGTPRFL